MTKSQVVPNPTDVLSAIEEWRNLDLRKENKDIIQKEFERVFFDVIQWAPLQNIKGHQAYYRIRKHDKTWENENELWAPSESIARKNRCNFDGEPMLYVSPKASTCFEELGIEAGRQVYIIKYRKRPDIPLKLRRLFSKEADPKDLSGVSVHCGDELIAAQILREFIRSEFMKPFCKNRKCKGTDFIYDFTASICSFMTMQQNDLDGFIYPSVVQQKNENVAFFSEGIREKLEIDGVRIVKLIPEDEWYADPRVDAKIWRPILRGKTHFLRSCFKAETSGEQISWFPCSDLGAF